VILADTSVWIQHFRHKENVFGKFLKDSLIVLHPFVIGELACGFLAARKSTLDLMMNLPAIRCADDSEALYMIERHSLMGRGLGYIDIHLLAAARLSKASLWTLDKALLRAANECGVGLHNS
jgi:predicted nucleic acid-binding protein